MQGLSDNNVVDLVPLKKTYEVGGKNLTFETGKIGLFANGAVNMSDENGNVLFTTVGIKETGLNEQASSYFTYDR